MEERMLHVLQNVNRKIPDDISVNLLAEGIIDSFDIVNIVSAISEEFGIEISPLDIVPENFQSAKTMIDLVNRTKA